MKQRRLTLTIGVLAIISSLFILIGFFLLAKIFGYPDIIREGPAHLLTELYLKRDLVPYLYYLVGLGGLLIIFISIGLRKITAQKSIFADFAMISGIISGLLLYIGLQRYFVLFPYLGELQVNSNISPEIIEVTFQALSKYIGFSLTEHSMFIFLALMILFFSIAFLKGKGLTKWIGWPGIALSLSLLYGSAEVINVPLGFMVNRIASKAAGLWLLALGIILIYKTIRNDYSSRESTV